VAAAHGQFVEEGNARDTGMKPRFILFAVLAIASLTVAGAARPTPAAAAVETLAAPLTFTHEVTVDPQRLAGEPDLAIARDGKQMYVSDPWGFSTTVSFTWKSEDGGAQWDNLHWFCAANPCARSAREEEVTLRCSSAAVRVVSSTRPISHSA
jgi:hypothetical protein